MEKVIRILLLEDTPTDAELQLRELSRSGIDHTSRIVKTEKDFIRELESWSPDLILADFSLPSFDGLSALAIARERSPETPFIFVTGTIGEEVAIETLKQGATDYVLKQRLGRLGPSVRRALKEAEELKRRREEEAALREQATHDSLTGLWNHEEILRILGQQLSRSEREGGDVSVIMADLDHFKKVNDTHGHMAGDTVLRLTAQSMLAMVRDYDYIGRYGGEEFLLVLPGCDGVRARELAERLCHWIECNCMDIPQEMLPITISLGVATTCKGKNRNADLLVQAADQALYRAKKTGRNRVVIAPDEV